MNDRFFFAHLTSISLFLLAAGVAGAAPAIGTPASPPPRSGLLVAPTRVTFDARERTAVITVVNTGREAATYRISFVQMKMDENGQIREVPSEEAVDNPADNLVRYSPRQIDLEPNVAQTVRLQLRKPADLAPGEYRSHLTFRALPPVQQRTADQSGSGGSGAGLSVRLNVIYGVSIPVLVRHGELWSKVAIEPLELRPAGGEAKEPVLIMKMTRDGNQSPYGNLTATLVRPDGREFRIGTMNGLAIYSPNRSRTVRMPLTPPPGFALERGRIRVSYAKADRDDHLLATAEMALR